MSIAEAAAAAAAVGSSREAEEANNLVRERDDHVDSLLVSEVPAREEKLGSGRR